MTRTDDKTLPAAVVAGHDTSADIDTHTTGEPFAVGGYQLGDVLGRGGMGEVIAAHDQRMEREVALKRMRDAAPTAESIERFVREAKIQARLDHPAIVPVHELGRDASGLPYFTMKRLAGTTLLDKLERGGPIQPLLRAFVDVCFAIELAHTRGVVHRDLKPSNIMLGDYGEVYVLDWGVARVVGTTTAPAIHLPIASNPPEATAAGALLGTPGYMAPEQIRGEDIGPAADVYALGAILFEIVAGEALHPRGGAALQSTLQNTAVCSPTARAPGRTIAPELDATCIAALAATPSDRPSARRLATRVQAYIDGDRDLDRRRALAAEELAVARSAVSSGDRALAMRSAGRALALDPASEAAELVTSLMLAPPPVLPPDAERDLEQGEALIDQRRGRRGGIAYLMIWVMTPLLGLLHVRSWPTLIAVIAGGTVMAGLVTLAGRGKLPMWALVACNIAYLVVFSRLGGPFMLTPILACGIAMAIGAQGRGQDRSALAIAVLGVMIALPVVLEAFGVLAHTWWMSPEGLVSRGTVFDGRQTGDAIGTIVATFALCTVITLYALSMNRARKLAQRMTYIQAWHLKQLLPPPTKR